MICNFVQKEREIYEVVVEDGKMMYRLSRKIVDTIEGPRNAKWIFVLSTTRILYIGTVCPTPPPP
jgi:hypothetical protein